MVAHLFLHLNRCIQIRLEGRIADCGPFSGNQFTAVRDASSGSASRRSSAKQNTSGRSSGSRPQNRKQGSSRNSRARARQKQKQANRTVLLVLLAILAVGLLIRGFTMNWQ